MNLHSLAPLLRNLGIPELRWLPSTGSTNEDAARWAEQGAPDWALLGAEEQTRGRGRLDRRWYTKHGAGLAFSIILRPSVAEQKVLTRFTALGGLAVSLAVEDLLNLKAPIKWPNDVIVHQRKVCGVLAETLWEPSLVQGGSTPKGIILGIGINIAPESVPPAQSLRLPATSLESEYGQPINRWDVLGKVVEHLMQWRPKIASPDFIREWEARLAWRGEQVVLDLPPRPPISGRLVGLTDEGQARLELPDGSILDVTAGDISLRQETT